METLSSCITQAQEETRLVRLYHHSSEPTVSRSNLRTNGARHHPTSGEISSQSSVLTVVSIQAVLNTEDVAGIQ